MKATHLSAVTTRRPTLPGCAGHLFRGCR